MAQVVTAQRAKIKVPILLMGASGAGKTLSALLVAKGIIEEMFPDMPETDQWKKVGLIDTEHQRASLYVNTQHDGTTIGGFLKVDLGAPFNSARLQDAFQSLEDAGAEVIILDSLSAAWSGQGGVRDQVDDAGGQFSDWKKVEPEQRAILNLLTGSRVHVIATARSKQGVEVTRNDVGKIEIQKVGLKPDMKADLEYEFAITFQLYQDHVAQAMKDNSSIFTTPTPLGREDGHKIYQWSEEGIDLVAEREAQQAKDDARRAKAQEAIIKLTQEHEDALIMLTGFEHSLGPVANWSMENLALGYKTIVAKLKQANTQKAGN